MVINGLILSVYVRAPKLIKFSGSEGKRRAFFRILDDFGIVSDDSCICEGIFFRYLRSIYPKNDKNEKTDYPLTGGADPDACHGAAF
jgi:hypothetical protein